MSSAKIYKHLKSGGKYLYITSARLESNLTPVVVYKSLKNWCIYWKQTLFLTKLDDCIEVLII